MPASKRSAPDTSDVASTGNPSSKIDIQPLRDLAKNFDLDIQPYLDEYLRLTDQCLEDGEVVGDYGDGWEDGVAQNFATAALKIQNSVGIYNRKVDFLHQTALEVFTDFVSSTLSSRRSNKSQRRTPSSSSGDPEIEAFNEYDPHFEFMHLDDVLPVDRSLGRKRINLREEERASRSRGSGGGGDNLDGTFATNGNDNNGSGSTPDVTLLSLGGVMSSTTRIVDHNGTFMINRSSLADSNNNVSPSAMSRMLLANLQGGRGGVAACAGDNNGGGNLRLLSGMCDIDRNGALVIPGTRAAVFVNGEAAPTSTADEDGGGGEDVQIFPNGLSPGPSRGGNDVSGFGAPMETEDNDASFGNIGGGGGDDDWGGGDDGVGFQLTDEHQPMEVGEDAHGEERKEDETTTAAAVPPPRPKKIVEDPWATLDPHEPSSKDKARPLRIGVTYRLPSEIDVDDRPSASVTGSSTRSSSGNAKRASKKTKENADAGQASSSATHDFLSPPFFFTLDDEALRDENGGEDGDDQMADESNGASSSLLEKETTSSRRHLILLEKFKRKELIFGDEFAYVAKAHAKHRDAVRRQRRLQQQQQQGDGAQEKEGETNALAGDFDDDDDDYFGGGGGFDFGGGDDDDSFGNNHHDGGITDDDPNNNGQNNGSIHRSNVDFTAIDDVFASSGAGGFDANDDYNNDDGNNFSNNDGTQTFEDLCRAHLRRFAKSAEAYATETQLTKRVGAWQDGLAPHLEEQEERPEFDIHSCGRQILQTVERNLVGRRGKRTSTGERKLESLKSSTSGDGSGSNGNNTVGFSTIFPQDAEVYEVCRLFLSTLMLCNCGNVAVVHNTSDEGEGEDDDGGDDDRVVVESLNSMDIELLNPTFQPPMETYMAPSAGEDSCRKEHLLGVDENAAILEG